MVAMMLLPVEESSRTVRRCPSPWDPTGISSSLLVRDTPRSLIDDHVLSTNMAYWPEEGSVNAVRCFLA